MWASYPKGEYIGFYWDNETGQRILQEVVGETIKKQFEDAVFWIPKNYDAYLKYMYHDYMQLPPEAKRCAHDNQAFWKVSKES